MKKKTYTGAYTCLNCGAEGSVEIPCGKEVKDMVCQNCGCKTLRSSDGLRTLRGIDG